MAFMLDADGLRRLSELLEENVLDRIEVPEVARFSKEDNGIVRKPLFDKEINYSVDFSDNSSLSTSSIEEVLRLPNSSKRKIAAIRLSTPYRADKIQANIRLRENSYTR